MKPYRTYQVSRHFAMYETGLPTTHKKLIREHGTRISIGSLSTAASFVERSIYLPTQPVPADRMPVKIKSGVIRNWAGDSLWLCGWL